MTINMKKYFPSISLKIISIIFHAILFAAVPQTGKAQYNMIHNSRIASLQVVSGTDWLSMPITQLGGNAINIDFDDMTHDYHRYTYKITHCEANWKESEGLFDTDYLQGFNGELVIDDIEQSLNTNHQYTHYHLSIPNENCRIKMSGNYRLTVYDDNAEEGENIMFTAYFMVVDPKLNVALAYTSNTDIDNNGTHQQVKMTVDYRNIHATAPNQQIKTVVLQNGRWDNAVVNAKPDYQSADQMSWAHNRQLIFKAGNEYHKFEMLDLDHPTMGIERIDWDGKNYHAYVIPDEPRPSYVYDESGQGAFYIRNSDNIGNNSQSDYATVHFTLKAPRQDGDVYLNGFWTNDSFAPEYLMEYDESTHCYHAEVKLKQGYYSYQYLVLRNDGSTRHVSTDGDFYQTANRYDALIYYKGTADRCDQLVGWKSIQ